MATDMNPQASPAGKAAWIVLMIAWACFLIPFPGLGLFVGWPLNLVAFILAIVAMANGGAMKGIIQLILSLVGSPIVYLIGTALFVAGVGVMGQQDAARRAVLLQSTVPALMVEVDAVDSLAAFQGG